MCGSRGGAEGEGDSSNGEDLELDLEEHFSSLFTCLDGELIHSSPHHLCEGLPGRRRHDLPIDGIATEIKDNGGPERLVVDRDDLSPCERLVGSDSHWQYDGFCLHVDLIVEDDDLERRRHFQDRSLAAYVDLDLGRMR